MRAIFAPAVPNKDISRATPCSKFQSGISSCHAFALHPVPLYLPLLASSSGYGGLSLAELQQILTNPPSRDRNCRGFCFA